jgi:hypothetical protein
MPTKNKRTYAAPKKAQTTKAAQGTTSHKRQVCDDSDSPSDNTAKRSQKRQKKKGKGPGRKAVHVPEESVDERSSEESNGPEAIVLDTPEPGSDVEHQHVGVCSRDKRLHISVDADYNRVILRSTTRQRLARSCPQRATQQRTST